MKKNNNIKKWEMNNNESLLHDLRKEKKTHEEMKDDKNTKMIW